MAKKNSAKSSSDARSNSSSSSSSGGSVVGKAKRTRKSVPRDSPAQRSSVHRGVTRHRWTGRYEAHLWDKNCWNESQSKKGRQVYLGAYDDEAAAAHAYDLAALKYWGQETILNFPLATYEQEIKEMDGQSKEEYIGSLRRKSSGFSRGVSKYRGVARHHHNGRWEARIGRVFGNKYLYLGTYATQEEAATAYDMAAIEYRGLNAVTNFDLSRYVNWIQPDQTDSPVDTNQQSPEPEADTQNLIKKQESSSSAETSSTIEPNCNNTSATSAFSLQSTEFNEMLEGTSDIPRRSFPDHIQTYFACHDSESYNHADDVIFGDLTPFTLPMFELDIII